MAAGWDIDFDSELSADTDTVVHLSSHHGRKPGAKVDFMGNSDRLSLPEKLTFLVNYGELFVVVVGAPGQGKSTTKTLLLEQLADVSPTVELVVAQRSQAQLLETLGKAFALSPGRGSAAPTIAHFQQFCGSLKDSHRRAVVVVDDAHWLKNDALKTLFEVAEKIGLGLVLFADPPIQRRAALQTFAARIYQCPLQALSGTAPGARSGRGRGDAQNAGKPTQLDTILAGDDGLDGDVDRRVDELLREPRAPRGLSLIHMAVLLVVVLGAAGLLIFEGFSTVPAEPQRISLDPPGSVSAVPFDEPLETPEAPSNTSLPAGVEALGAAGAPAVSAANASIPSLPAVNGGARAALVPTNAARQSDAGQVPLLLEGRGQVSDGDRNIALEVILPLAQQSVPATPAERVAPAPRTASATNSWIYNARPGEYTLQLMGSYSASAIRDAIAAMPDPGQFDFFETRRGNQAWYVLTAGRYASREAAISAIDKLPLDLRVQQPWARSAASIVESQDQ